MKNKAYWKKRMENLAKEQEIKADDLVERLEKEYKKAISSIQNDIEVFYLRYADAEGISYSAARKMLKNIEKENWELNLEEYKHMALDGGFEKRLDSMYAKSRISRLQALNAQINANVEVLHKKILDNTSDLLEDTFTDTYYKTVYEIQKGTGLGISFKKYNQDAVNKIVSKPWKYGNFSSNLWKDKAKLLDELETSLAQSFIRGDDVRKTIKRFSERMKVDKYRAARIIQTESAYISGEASAKAYKSQGVDEYEFLATLDLKTSTLCQSMDGKVFKMSQKETGVNYPPLHSFCRSTTVPYFEEDDNGRAARVDSKTFYVDGDIKYQDWYTTYVANTDGSDIIKSKAVKLKYPDITTIRDAEEWGINNLALNSVSYKGINVEVANYINKSLYEIYEEYPLLKGFVQNVKTDGRLKATAAASLCYQDGNLIRTLKLSKRDLSNISDIDKLIKQCVKTEWWTPKDGIKGIVKHEMGHMVEYAVTMKEYGLINTNYELTNLNVVNECFKALRKGEISHKIKLEALRNLGISNTKRNIVKELSEYGSSDSCEFLAEAVSENNPRALAKEVIKILNKKIGSVWK